MRFFAPVLLFLVFLAGCSSMPAPDAPPTATPPANPEPAATAPALPMHTDTLYLLDAPHMQALPPTGDSTLRTPVPNFRDQFSGTLLQGTGTGLFWDLPRSGLNVLEGNATLWVDVQGTVTNPNGGLSGCFWQTFLRVDNGTQGGFTAQSGPCLEEESIVAQGVRELFVPFSAFDLRGVDGQTIRLWVYTAGEYAPGASVSILSGSADHPSRLSLRGLSLPLDTVTLLQ